MNIVKEWVGCVYLSMSTPIYLIEIADPTDYNWLIIYSGGTRSLRHPGINMSGMHLLQNWMDHIMDPVIIGNLIQMEELEVLNGILLWKELVTYSTK